MVHCLILTTGGVNILKIQIVMEIKNEKNTG